MAGNYPRRVAILALTGTAILVAAATSAHGATPLTQRFTLSGVTVHGADRPVHIVATGPISGNGTVSGAQRARRHDHLVLRLTRGTVTIDVNETSVAAHPNYHTCTAQMIGRGTFTITSGSGSFKGATGTGAFSRHSTMIGSRGANGACASKNTPPKAVYTTATFLGKAAVPTG